MPLELKGALPFDLLIDWQVVLMKHADIDSVRVDVFPKFSIVIRGKSEKFDNSHLIF